ncbi:MAG: hypothetical protein FWC50_01825, partial [Planctomycetaceae bacterium]|nr:hypothetical protein [Planctomycetaceae bacterium]
EQKVTMEQRALTAVNELKEVEAKAKQTEATAKGKAAAILETAKAEAESLELRSKAATPMVAFLNFVEKWDGKLPTTVTLLGKGSDLVPILDVSAAGQQLKSLESK